MASPSASCTELTYGMRSSAPVYSCDSSPAPPHGAGPRAAALETNRTRSTSARRLSSSTIRAPPTLASNMRSASAGRIEVMPAAWNTRSTPFIARRTARRSSTSQVTSSASRSSISRVSELSRTVIRSSSPRSVRARARWAPTKPVAPVSRVRGMAASMNVRR